MSKTLRIIILVSIIALNTLPMSSNANTFFSKTKQFLHLERKEESIWEDMRNDFRIECDTNNPRIQKEIKWYQQHPRHLSHLLRQATPFIQYVRAQVRAHNLPAELALIPLIESEYNPAIGAKSGAAGLWQMMPKTATKFGLKINRSYDGRRDVAASTNAALNYLAYLHHNFNKDWLLAFAAYDAGEGKIKSVMRRHSINFWKLPLSRETKKYIPRLLALATIIKDPSTYHIRLPQISKETALQEVNVANINVEEFTRITGIDAITLRRYNPSLRKNIVTTPQAITLLLPNSVTTTGLPDTLTFMPVQGQVEVEEAPVRKKDLHTSVYHVKSNDTLSSIAKHFHVKLKELKKLNNLKSSKLKIGKSLKIPLRHASQNNDE